MTGFGRDGPGRIEGRVNRKLALPDAMLSRPAFVPGETTAPTHEPATGLSSFCLLSFVGRGHRSGRARQSGHCINNNNNNNSYAALPSEWNRCQFRAAFSTGAGAGALEADEVDDGLRPLHLFLFSPLVGPARRDGQG